jgi:signal peptidase I
VLVADLAGPFLKAGNVLRLRARGGSMLPFLRDGDLLEIWPAAPVEIRVGDVLCYEPSPGALCLHRVVARDERGFVTRGDALTHVEVVPAGSVLGRVRAVERRGRAWRLDTWSAHWRARVIVVASPALARLLPSALGLRRVWRTVLRG